MAGVKALSSPDVNGLKIINLGDGTAGTDAATKGQVDTAETNAKSRATHTGTQTAATISDFSTEVRTSRLDQMAAPTGSVSLNSQKIVGLLDPTGAQDAATMAYVDAQLAGLSSGLVLKGSVRAAVDSNVDISAPGATLDGLTAASGQLFWLRTQTTPAEQGPWVFNGDAAAMTRPANFNTSGEAVLGSFWDVREGTHADTFLLMTNDTAVTLETTTLTSVIRGATAVTDGYTTTCPSVSGGATWTVTHNLGTRAVLASVARVGSPYDFVDIRIERTTTSTLSILPDVALSSGEFEVMVKRI